MRIRSFIIVYALVLAILLFADRRTTPSLENRYSHIVDMTGPASAEGSVNVPSADTRLIAPAALIPGTWSAAQIPAGRLVAPLVVLDLKVSADQTSQVTLEEVAAWEEHHGVMPQGSIVAFRRASTSDLKALPLPITADAATFLMDSRDVLGFAVESTADVKSDRILAHQIALHGAYVVTNATHFSSLPETGSLVIVAPVKSKNSAESSVRVMAMVK
jgi:kynurenine formamidase